MENAFVIDKYKKYRLRHQKEFICANCKKKFMRFFKMKGTFCSIDCQAKYLRGKKLSKEYKLKIGRGVATSNKYREGIKKRILKPNSSWFVKNDPRISGKNSYNWKGGISEVSAWFRKTGKYKNWRLAILERDNFCCVMCGSRDSLEVDHIKRWSDFPEFRYNVPNGRTLCNPCHRKTETYGNRKITKEIERYNYV